MIIADAQFSHQLTRIQPPAFGENASCKQNPATASPLQYCPMSTYESISRPRCAYCSPLPHCQALNLPILPSSHEVKEYIVRCSSTCALTQHFIRPQVMYIIFEKDNKSMCIDVILWLELQTPGLGEVYPGQDSAIPR